MDIYIALLRGINVGGKNKIKMAELKLSFEDLGYQNVRTYINSGNVLFKSDCYDAIEIQKSIEKMILDSFNLMIPVCVITHAQLVNIIKHSPDWWDKGENTLDYAIFVLQPFQTTDVLMGVGEPIHIYEEISHYDRVIYWTASLDTYTKSRWYKIASSSVNDAVTIRNSNTVNKLLLLAKELESM